MHGKLISYYGFHAWSKQLFRKYIRLPGTIPNYVVADGTMFLKGNYAVSGGLKGIEAVEAKAKSFKARMTVNSPSPMRHDVF